MRHIIQKITGALHPSVKWNILPSTTHLSQCQHLYAFTSALSLALHHILASLVKGRWIDGKAQTVALLRFTCDTPAFFIHQTFLPSRRKDCSVAPNTATITFVFLIQYTMSNYIKINYWLYCRTSSFSHSLYFPPQSPTLCDSPFFPLFPWHFQFNY